MRELSRTTPEADSVMPRLLAGRHAGVSSARSRLMFALWPQAYAHSSWIERSRMGGLLQQGPWSADAFRCPGPDAGATQRLAAHLLLGAVGANPQDGVASTWLPAWVHRSSERVRLDLSALLGSLLAPMLRRAVSPAVGRHLDGVVGPAARRAALVLAEHHATLQRSPDLDLARRFARSWFASRASWEQGSLALGASILGAQVHPEEASGGAIARLRLLFPAVTPLGALVSFDKAWLRELGTLLDHPVLAGACELTATQVGSRP